jgi:ribonuclease HI
MRVEVFTDGASRGNPGHAGIGVVIFKDGENILQIKDYIGETTNNVAEYTALKRALVECKSIGAREIKVYMDSELVVRQISGQYKVKNENLRIIFNEVKELMTGFSSVEASYVPRKDNSIADDLANKGIDEKVKK